MIDYVVSRVTFTVKVNGPLTVAILAGIAETVAEQYSTGHIVEMYYDQGNDVVIVGVQ